MIERIPIESEAQWKRAREGNVTASTCAALFGVHEFTSYWQLYRRVVGKPVDESAESAAMERGNLLEPVAIAKLRKQFPAWRFEVPRTFYLDREAKIGATPDLFGWPPGAGAHEFWNIQIKSVEPSVFRKKWRVSGGNNQWETEPPLWIAVQSLLEAHLSGALRAAVAPLRIGHGIEIDVLEIPENPALIERLYAAAAIMHDRVARCDEPDPDYAVDAAALAALYGDEIAGKAIDLSGDNRIVELLDRHKELAAIETTAKKERKAIKAEIMDKMRDAEVATIGRDARITFRTIYKKAYTVAASATRQMRVYDNRRGIEE